MNQNCWQIWPDRGFLINPDPLVRLTSSSALSALIPHDTLEHLQQASTDLPELLQQRKVRTVLDALPVYDMSPLNQISEFYVVERLMQLYGYLASAFVYATNEEPEHRIPAGVAKPLYQLSQMVERPPILTYTSYVLTNWQRAEANARIEVDKLALVQNFLGVRDEQWFILIHTDIEARAAGALSGIQVAAAGADEHDAAKVEQALGDISRSLQQMQKTFDRMPEECNSDVYYFRVRPYIFGFTDIIYEGVEAYGGKPQSFRGQTGAQSSIIPALVAGLGLQHEQTGLTQHLDVMKAYMPKPHREFIAAMGNTCIRAFVVENAQNSALSEAYNECLRNVLAFRKLHLHYATTYIANKVMNPVGTGGTIFMDWLSQLVQETEAQLV
jgi:indoleamine 2,3-dioxygenase